MLDQYNREIDYLRISVTDRCNLRCRYCMPETGIKLLPHSAILSFEQIAAFVQVAAALGIKRIKLTGGEPLVRRGVVNLVALLRGVPGLDDISMTTNGLLLERYAAALAAAGLQRVNISLDTLDADYYGYITRGGDLQSVLRGIDAALHAGLTPVKLNCVVDAAVPGEHARSVADYAAQRGLAVQFIRRMELASGSYYAVEGGKGGRCAACNRLRLTSNGIVKPCLFNDLGYDMRSYGAEQSILLAIKNKPRAGECCHNNLLYNIGG